jgi:hypothetical protein
MARDFKEKRDDRKRRKLNQKFELRSFFFPVTHRDNLR